MGKPDQPRNPDNGRWRKRGVTFIVAASIALGMAYFGTTGGASTATRPASSTSVKTKHRSFAKVVTRLKRQSRTMRRLDEAFDQDCTRQSYGQVQNYLRRIPVKASEGRSSRSRARRHRRRHPDGRYARRDRRAEAARLVDPHGTGTITGLRGTRRVTWTGEQYASGRHETTVVNAQAEPSSRTVAAVRLAFSLADSVV